MTIETHLVNGTKIAEVIADDVFIKKPEDILDILGNIWYQGYDKLILHQKNITVDFFNLENGIAGEILQKFSNYRVRLAIVGDVAQFKRKKILFMKATGLPTSILLVRKRKRLQSFFDK